MYYCYDITWFISDEMFYFLTSSVLIFYSYKKNLRLDYFLLIFAAIVLIGKFFLFYFTYPNFLPLMFYQKHDNYYIMKNPLYLSPSFIAGLFFGMVNYCIQKSMTQQKLNFERKNFLTLPLKYISFYKTNTFIKILLSSILTLVLFTLTTISFVLCYRFFFMETDPYMSAYFMNYYINLLFVYDVELAIIFLYMFITPLMLHGDNSVLNFLKSSYWNILTKPYFSYLMTIDLIVIYIFYSSETRVKVDFYNIIFMTILAMMISIFINSLIYIIIEVPLKKLNKFIMEKDHNTFEEVIFMDSMRNSNGQQKSEGEVNKSKV
jgi:hypothetical protein